MQVPNIKTIHIGKAGCNSNIDWNYVADISNKAIEIAPADQQPWITVQDGETLKEVDGLLYDRKHDNSPEHRVDTFKVTGIAKGWELK